MSRPTTDRRALLAALAAAGAAPHARAAARDPQALAALAGDAYRFFTPLYEMCRTRDHQLAEAGGPNVFLHRRNLQGPSDRRVTTPNSDTLYSTGFLDLGPGPVRLTTPPTGERYFSLALMDAWSNNFHIAGTRTGGGRGGALVVATAEHAARARPAPGERLVVAPTRWVWALARILTEGGADLAAARALQDRITAAGAAGSPPPKAPPPDADLALLWGATRPLAADAGVLAADRPALVAMARRARALGIDPRAPALDPRLAASGAPALAEARERLRHAAADQPYVDGWTYPRPDIGDFGADDRYRADIAILELAALPIHEAMYMWAVGPGAGGAPGAFDGRRAWRLDLPRMPLERAGFWSLSLYAPTPTGAFFFVENPLRRYAIGDRTPGLVRRADGGVSLHIGAADPGGAARANWLPAPESPFALVMRAFLPAAALRDGRFRLPAVRPA